MHDRISAARSTFHRATWQRVRVWVALGLACSAWALLWGQGLYGFSVVPQPIVALVFFAGLALGAFDQHCRRPAVRMRAPLRSSQSPNHSFVLKGGFSR